MTGKGTEIPLVGRTRELQELKNHLKNATQGYGNLLFIEGEAGVGKTKLLSELINHARSQGVQILQGWSLYESLTPYMPLIDALHSAKLDHLFSRENPPKVECVYLINNSGLLISKVEREESPLDPDIFAGMLTAVESFVQDSLNMLGGKNSIDGKLNTLGYENYRIVIESGKNTNIVTILTGRENEFLINDMREILMDVEKNYGNILRVWNGLESSISGIEQMLKSLITSGKYDSIDYTKSDPMIKRNRLFENILLGIERYAKNNPSLLCIEDLQWADPSTLALIHYIARNTRKCNLLILGTYRPEDVTITEDGEVHHLIKAMQLMGHEDLYQKIELKRLEEVHIEEMLFSLLGNINFKDEFKNQLYKETEGNPFFIIELIRMLIEEETIEKKDNGWTLTKVLKEVRIPSKVQDVIVRRLSKVNKKGREILDYAAVFGEEFASTTLAYATHLNKIDLLEQLRTLEQNHKLIRSLGAKYKFDHAMIKEVLYNRIPAELRMEYHTIIADTIETMNKNDLDNVIEDLAFHYYHGKNTKKGLSYLIKAAEKAKKDYSNEEAIRFYTEALELEEDTPKRSKMFETLGDIYEMIGNYDRSLELYKKALELAQDKKKMARIKAKIGKICLRTGEAEYSLKLCTEALDLVKGEECMEEALAINNLGSVYWFKGEYDRAFEHYEKSLKIREKIDDQRGMATSLHNIGIMHYWREDYDRAIENIERGLEIAESIDDLYFSAYCLLSIGYVLENTEKYDKAQEYVERNRKINEKVGSQRAMSWYYFHSATISFRKGDLKRAHEFCEKALDLSAKVDAKESIAETKRVLGMIYREQKKWKESIENFEYNIKYYQNMGDNWHIGDAYYEFGLMWKEKGDIENARHYLNKALDVFEQLKMEKHKNKMNAELRAL